MKELWGVMVIQLNQRQKDILNIVKESGPITGENIANRLKLTRASLRPDLAFLTQVGLLDARPRVGYYFKGEDNNYDAYRKIIDLKVKDYQNVPVIVNENTSVYDTIVSMFVNDVGTIYIVNDESELMGVVSRKDMLKMAIGQANINELPVRIVMTRMPNIIVVTEDESLWQAARKMIEHEVDSLPVVTIDEHGGYEVLGRLTKTNITRAFMDLSSGNVMD